MTVRRVVVVRSPNIAWSALLGLLETLPDVEVVGEATSVADGLVAVHRLVPDVLVTGWMLDTESVQPLLVTLRREDSRPRVVVIAGHLAAEEVRVLPRLGAEALLLWRDLTASAAQWYLRSAVCGTGFVASPPLTSVALEAARGGPPTAHEQIMLTGREREVLGLLADGLTEKAVADRLGVSRSTVASHVRGLYRKLGAANALQLGVIAQRRGLIG